MPFLCPHTPLLSPSLPFSPLLAFSPFILSHILPSRLPRTRSHFVSLTDPYTPCISSIPTTHATPISTAPSLLGPPLPHPFLPPLPHCPTPSSSSLHPPTPYPLSPLHQKPLHAKLVSRCSLDVPRRYLLSSPTLGITTLTLTLTLTHKASPCSLSLSLSPSLSLSLSPPPHVPLHVRRCETL